MPWNDEIFQREIEAAAAAAGKSRTAAYKEAGLGKSGTGTAHTHGPRIDLFERLMIPLEWSPADALRVIAACFEWPASEEVEEIIDGVASAPPPAQAVRGEVRIVLKNVEVRVLSSDED